jgi:hypothetical protein
MRTPTPLRAAIVISLVAVVAALAIEFVKKPPAPQPLDHLAAFVGSHGKLAPLAPAVARFFGIPEESVVFTQCSVISESGRTRSIGVRLRPKLHYIDILLIDTEPGVDGAYFYLTSTTGELVESAYFDTEPHKIDDAEQRFEHERDFWLFWQNEKLKHDAK